MNVAQLRIVLEHLPDDLTVFTPAGEVCEVRRNTNDPWRRPGVWLDIARRGEPVWLQGRFHDRRTLEVRLEALSS